MYHHKLVLPEFINDQGTLFGGYLLKWIDELSYITARIDFPDCKLVTIALDDLVFKHAIHSGSILRFEINQDKVGNTSIKYLVKVYLENSKSEPEKVLLATNISFVNVDSLGNKKPI